jgi:hypothetical protein
MPPNCDAKYLQHLRQFSFAKPSRNTRFESPLLRQPVIRIDRGRRVSIDLIGKFEERRAFARRALVNVIDHIPKLLRDFPRQSVNELEDNYGPIQTSLPRFFPYLS